MFRKEFDDIGVDLEPVEEGIDANTDDSFSFEQNNVNTKRRQFGTDTAGGIEYRKKLEEERALECATHKRNNLYAAAALFVVTLVVLIVGICGIVSKIGEKKLKTQTYYAKQVELQESLDNPIVIDVPKEADIVNGSDFSDKVCAYQNDLTSYVYNEVLNKETLSETHIACLDEYRTFAKNTRLDRISLQNTWLSDLLTEKRIAYIGRSKNPFTWVADNDYDRKGLETDVVFTCYSNYGSVDQEMIMSVVMHYNSKDNIVSKFSIYCSDAYMDIASVR